mgnify:CR=1 FL=1
MWEGAIRNQILRITRGSAGYRTPERNEAPDDDYINDEVFYDGDALNYSVFY